MDTLYTYRHPFSWGVDHNNGYISSADQRNAKYTKTTESGYQGSELDAFFKQDQSHYLQISNICGIDCPDDGCNE